MFISPEIRHLHRHGMPARLAAEKINTQRLGTDIEPILVRDVTAAYREINRRAAVALLVRITRDAINDACGVRRVTLADTDRPGYSTDCGKDAARLHNVEGIKPDGSRFVVGMRSAPTKREWRKACNFETSATAAAA